MSDPYYDIVVANNAAAADDVDQDDDHAAIGHNHDGTYVGFPAGAQWDVFGKEVAHTNWDGFSTAAADAWFGGTRFSTGAQNATVTLPAVPMLAGTWTFTLLHFQSTDRGIYTIAISDDGFSSSTAVTSSLDGYAGSGTQTRSQVTGIAVPRSGLWQARFTMATKNASSSGYAGVISGFMGTRTGA